MAPEPTRRSRIRDRDDIREEGRSRSNSHGPSYLDHPSNSPALILSKFNTIYRHSVLDILTHYAGIPTDPNPDNNPLSTRDPNDSLNNDPNVATTLLNSKTQTANSISNVKLKSIALDEVVVSFKYPNIELEMLKPIPFDKACGNYHEVEQTLIKMSKEAAAARNLSHLRVSGIQYANTLWDLVLIALISLLPIGHYYSNVLYESFFATYFPFMLKLQPYHDYIMYATILIHLMETYFLLFPRFTRYRVPLDYAIEWTVLTLLEGAPSIKRFDRYVELISSDDVYYDFSNTDYMD